MEELVRIINPIKRKIGNQYGNVFLKLEIKRQKFWNPKNNSNYFGDLELTISGVEAPLKSGNCRGSCGQIDMEYRKGQYTIPEIIFTKGWNKEKWNKLLNIWKKYHLKTNIPDEVYNYIKNLENTKTKYAWV